MNFIWGLVIVLALSMSAPAVKQPAVNSTGQIKVKMDQDGTRIVVKGEKQVACDEHGICLDIGIKVGTD